jgi:hypothetical protein
VGNDFNDITSSIVVVGPTPPAPVMVRPLPTNGVTIYEDGGFGGRAVVLTPGRYDIGQLGQIFGNDILSSIRVPAGYEAVLYADGGFAGRSKVVTSDLGWIGDDFNDVTSSIIVAERRDVAPPPTYAPAPTAIGDEDFNAVKAAINNASFSQEKLDALAMAKSGRFFTVDQVGELVELYSFPNDKVQAVELVKRNLIDPENGFKLLERFTFPSDKERVRKLLAK